MNDKVLELKDVSKAYPGVVALDHVSLDLKRGEVLALMGEYLLSLGVTGYEGDDFTVYHRLYDVLNMTVISDKDTVGFYDPESAVQVL